MSLKFYNCIFHGLCILIGKSNKNKKLYPKGWWSSYFTVLITIPKRIIVPNKEEPPAETKGKGIPVMGKRAIFIPM